jgi:signal transduction histidine kinase
LFAILARNRSLGVASAIVAEAVLLVPLAYANPASIVGIPAAIAAAIAGTVAVVLGPAEGALVAFAGALAFGTFGGWGTGQIVSLALWPAIVVAAGMFGHQVARQQKALGQLVDDREEERQRLALALHDDTAQMLAASLMALEDRAQVTGSAPPQPSDTTTRALIQETIQSVRALAVDLWPKALDDFGLAAALSSLTARFTERTEMAVGIDLQTGDTRLPPEIEVIVFRLVQEVLGQIESDGNGGAANIAIRRQPTDVVIVIDQHGGDATAGVRSEWTSRLTVVRERIRLAGGRLSTRTTNGDRSVRVTLPLERA